MEEAIPGRPLDPFNRAANEKSDLEERFPDPEDRKAAQAEIDKAKSMIAEAAAVKDAALKKSNERADFDFSPGGMDPQAKHRQAQREAHRNYNDKAGAIEAERDQALQKIADGRINAGKLPADRQSQDGKLSPSKGEKPAEPERVAGDNAKVAAWEKVHNLESDLEKAKTGVSTFDDEAAQIEAEREAREAREAAEAMDYEDSHDFSRER